MNSFFVVVALLVGLVISFGCVDQGIVMPVTNAQVLLRSTCITSSDLNNYNTGYFDGNLVFVDNNILCFVSPNDLNIDVNSGTVNHSLLTNLGWSVAGHVIDTDFLPENTLTESLGTGALRWLNLFVQNINSEEIDTYNLVASEDVNVGGNAYLDGNIFGNTIYGGMYDHNADGVSIPFGVQYTYYFFTGGTCGMLNGFDCNTISGELTANYGGVYEVHYEAIGVGQNNHIYHTMIFINDVNNVNTLSHTLHDAGTVSTLVGMGHIKLVVGDKVSLRIQDYSGTSSGTVYNWNMILKRIGN